MTAPVERTEITIDLTPSWTAILPVLLASRAAMERTLAARGCDGQVTGWCHVHEAGYDAEAPAPDAACAFAAGATPADLARRRAGIVADLTVNDAAFADMARAADAYNLLARTQER